MKKHNYIWDCINTDNIANYEHKDGNKNWKNFLKKKKKRKERKQNRIPKKYSVYIKSKWWKKRKNRYYQSFGKICMICDSCRFIQLHHIEYKNKEFGNERDEDLIALCRECHEEFHFRFGIKKTCIRK